jgi:hypothetical protein
MDALDVKVQYEIGYLLSGSLVCTEISSYFRLPFDQYALSMKPCYRLRRGNVDMHSCPPLWKCIIIVALRYDRLVVRHSYYMILLPCDSLVAQSSHRSLYERDVPRIPTTTHCVSSINVEPLILGYMIST